MKVKDNKAKEAYAKLCEVHNVLAARLKFATDPKLGFLAADLEGVGSGNFAVEAVAKCEPAAAAREKARANSIVTVTKEGNGMRLRGKARFGASPADVLKAVFQSVPAKK